MKKRLGTVVGKLVPLSNNEDYFSLGMLSSSNVELSCTLQPFRNFI